MAIEVLRDHIKTMLQTETDIQEVHDYPTIDFNGYPRRFMIIQQLTLMAILPR